MKKLLFIILAITILFSLAACGSAAVTMVDITSDAGITAKLPSNLTTTDNKTYTDKKSGANAVFVSEDAASDPISAYSQESLLATYQNSDPDAAITSFDTSKQVDGMQSVQAVTTTKTPGGVPITVTIVLFTDGTNNYIVNFTCPDDDKDGPLAKNLQACIDSLSVAAQ